VILKRLKKIQKQAKKVLIKQKNKPYKDRLVHLNLPTLEYRRLRGDMIEVFKITHNTNEEIAFPYLPFNTKANTKGNNYKLLNHSFHYNLRKHYFSAGIVNN